MKTQTKFKQTEIGLIPEDWEIVKIDSVGKVITEKTPPTKDKDNYGNEYMFVKIPDFGNSVYITDTNTKLSSKGAEYMRRLKISKESVMISCIAIVGEVGIASEDCFTNQQINSLTPNENKVKSKWAYYFFKNYKDYLKSNGGGGSVYTNISKSKFQNLSISLPELEEQEKISDILFHFDSKIELLQKQNETLEKIGKEIFRHWFVDFEFPNEDGLPYKSSGGEMVGSDLGEIHKGWSVENYGELLEFERGIEPGSKNYLDKKEDNTILFYRVGDLLSEDSTIYVKKDIIKNKIANKNNVLVSFDGTVGRVKIGIEGSYSTGIRKVYSKDNLFTNGFIYFLMKSDFIQNKITEFAKGTTILHAGEAIKHFITVIPNDKIKTNFNIIIENIFEKLLVNIDEIKNLQKIRVLLLPKLMTGKIKVPLKVEE